MGVLADALPPLNARRSDLRFIVCRFILLGDRPDPTFSKDNDPTVESLLGFPSRVPLQQRHGSTDTVVQRANEVKTEDTNSDEF